jgi:hypothetical protein
MCGPLKLRKQEKETRAMASQPLTNPDTIDPQSPEEAPSDPTPTEAPQSEPPGVSPVGPDFDQPDRAPSEFPAPD